MTKLGRDKGYTESKETKDPIGSTGWYALILSLALSIIPIIDKKFTGLVLLLVTTGAAGFITIKEKISESINSKKFIKQFTEKKLPEVNKYRNLPHPQSISPDIIIYSPALGFNLCSEFV
jgi:hypothetical protein